MRVLINDGLGEIVDNLLALTSDPPAGKADMELYNKRPSYKLYGILYEKVCFLRGKKCKWSCGFVISGNIL